VPNLKFREPPSALNPQATAMASNRVDFPEPFSPTKNVTAGWNSNRFLLNGRTAESEKGYFSNDSTSSLLSRISTRYCLEIMVVG
jgi:hypothetical protein